MAVDTKHKRYSAIMVSLPWRGALPDPDGTISAADRLLVGLHYSGIAAVGIVAGPFKIQAGQSLGPTQLAGHVYQSIDVASQVLAPSAMAGEAN